ncbi:hypothetical protein OAF54_01145 [bacterium]|nr:hypothetical protein [bacterium]
MAELKLLPCPFCGCEPYLDYEEPFTVCCENKNCPLGQKICSEHFWVLVDQWQTRAQSKELQEAESDLEAASQDAMFQHRELQTLREKVSGISEALRSELNVIMPPSKERWEPKFRSDFEEVDRLVKELKAALEGVKE